MGTKTKQQEKKLTAYESRQVEKIAAWKAEFPNPFGELFRRTVQPLANVVENIIPDRLALKAIDASYNVSDYTATLGDIKIQAGVKDITELRHKPLEVCDDLSRRVGTAAQGIATVEGVLTGAGGVISTLLDVPLLFTLCLRTIIKIGHCYGYPLDRPTDKAWVLGALAVALSATKEKRTDLMVRLREIEELLVEEVQENIVVEETASLLTQIEILEDIPVVGAVTGGLLNLSVAHRTDVTARHLFQERWLRDNGKVEEIEPGPHLGVVPPLYGWSGVFARAGYSTLHSLSFGVAFPFCLAAEIFTPVTRPLTSRIGALAAASGGNGRLDGLVGALVGTGIPEEKTRYYQRELEAGHTIVTVKADGRYDEAASILRRHGAYDMHTAASRTAGTAARGQAAAPQDRATGIEAITHEQIAKRAYEIWQQRGYPPGTEQENWLEAERQFATGAATAAAPASRTVEGGEKIQLHEEELQVHKQPVETGAVRVRKEAVTEHRTMEIPVQREEVVIERQAPTGEPTSASDIAPGEEIRVPVSEE
jgi:hypothetical protein